MFQNTIFLGWPIATLEFGGGGGGPPQLTAAEKRKQHLDELSQKHAMEASFKTPDIQIPPAPAPVTIPPAPSQSSADIEDSQQEARKSSARKYGLLRTTYAGNTGGYGGYTAAPLGAGAGKSLLG